MEFPELAAKPEYQAALIAAFWSWKGMNDPADAGDFTAVVRRWNGGTIGMADRRARLAGNDIAIRDLPDIERMEVETAVLPRKTTAKDGAIIAAGGGGVVTVGVQQGWGVTEWVMAVAVIAVIAGVAYFIIKQRRKKLIGTLPKVISNPNRTDDRGGAAEEQEQP